MTKPKLTEDGLPVVSIDSVKSFTEILKRERNMDQVADNIKERLLKENRRIYNFVDGVYKQYGESDFVDGVAFGVAITYELLRKQSEANKLEKEVNDSKE